MKITESTRAAMIAAGMDPDELRVPRGKAAEGKPPQARYTKPGDDGMTGLERQWDLELYGRKLRGEIFDYQFQSIKLLIVEAVAKTGEAEGIKSAWYAPDFVVYENDGTISVHETKGFLDRSNDGWLKFKAAAAKYPFAFYMVQRVKKEWVVTRYAR